MKSFFFLFSHFIFSTKREKTSYNGREHARAHGC